MRSVEAGRFAIRVLLDYLGDWKDPIEFAKDLGITTYEAKFLLEDLCKKGLVVKDGNKYLRRWGM